MTTPFPGSPLFNILDKKGLLLTKDWGKYDIYREQIFRTDELNRDLVLRMFKKAYRELYFNPKYIWNKVKTLKNTKDIKVAVGGAFRIVGRVLGVKCV